MCGIAGIITGDQKEEVLGRMSDSMAHRGPDNAGFYLDDFVGLAHRRLSILDLSTAANQPFLSEDKRYVLVYNGEVYNSQDLKQQLAGYPFQTKSDTEVVLASFLKWGVDSFSKFNGMFAFGLWDCLDKTLYIVRDRSGIKPVYYTSGNNCFLFSSEVRAVLASGIIPRKLNADGILEYFQYQTVHAPNTLIQDVKMLEAGHYLKIKADTCLVEDFQYAAISDSIGDKVNLKPYEQIKEDIYHLLLKSVERRMVSDVPMGAFLSGGIDSSILVGLMSQLSESPVNTFTINFDESAYSEAKYARMVADKFNTNHSEILLKPKDFLNALPSALSAIDHPSGDGPNTWIVSNEVAKQGIKVAFSGLGGDELFAGYAHFKRALIYHKYGYVAKFPNLIKYPLGYILKKARPSIATSKFVEVLMKDHWDLKHTYPIGRRMFLDDELVRLLHVDVKRDRVEEICSTLPESKNRSLSQVTLAEFATYMQHVLLRDTDQMSMAIPIEGRLPFLDNDLIEYVLRVPDAVKNPLTPKKLLVDSVGDLLPSEIVNRPKMGFVLPWDVWMRNDMLEFCNSAIHRLCDRPFIDSSQMQQLWNRFLKGDKSISWSRIWYLIVLEYWLERYDIS